MPWKLKQDSFTKCISYFADGNTRTFYSFDWKHRYSKIRDRHLGLNGLRKLISDWGAKSNMAIIYDNTTGEELERYEQGLKLNN